MDMKKYMVITVDEEGNHDAFFTDDFNKAEDHRSIACVSMGYYAEVYERIADEEGSASYEFLYS